MKREVKIWRKTHMTGKVLVFCFSFYFGGLGEFFCLLTPGADPQTDRIKELHSRHGQQSFWNKSIILARGTRKWVLVSQRVPGEIFKISPCSPSPALMPIPTALAVQHKYLKTRREKNLKRRTGKRDGNSCYFFLYLLWPICFERDPGYGHCVTREKANILKELHCSGQKNQERRPREPGSVGEIPKRR